MLYIYMTAAFFAGWLFPEFVKAMAPRNYIIPWMMNFMSGFIGAALLHFLLTH